MTNTGIGPLYSLTSICLLRYIRNMLTTLGALAEPNRLHIVELLRDGPRSVGEISARLGLHQPQVSKHLRALSKAGFVEAHPVAQQRIYQLRPQPFHELDVWLQSYRHVWGARFDRLETYLRDVQQQQQGQEQHHDDKQ
jgi:DNA-binding transcriptional ArsR family regulator